MDGRMTGTLLGCNQF